MARHLSGSGAFAVNKVVLLMWLSVIVCRPCSSSSPAGKQQLVPTGVQNVAESVVDFVREGIIMQTMGKDGLGYTPFLLTIFSFIFVCNIWEVIPVVQMPVNARIALPALMAILVWLIYNVVGFKNQGHRLPQERLLPAGRAEGRSTSW